MNPTWDGREHTSKRLVDAADSLLEKLGDPYAQYYPPEETWLLLAATFVESRTILSDGGPQFESRNPTLLGF